jgi:hypothetical protein
MMRSSELLLKFREACIKRGADGIRGIAKLFHLVDKEKDSKINFSYFLDYARGIYALFCECFR